MSLFEEDPVEPHARLEAWTRYMLTFQDSFIDDDAAENQAEYLRTAKKPKDMGLKVWIQLMRIINNYLPCIGQTVARFSKEQLVRHCITPNIPNSWKKDFELGGGHLLQRRSSKR